VYDLAEITLLLRRWESGDAGALEALMPLVYEQLRQVAGSYIRRERQPDLLQPTMLVNELYLRLLNQRKAAWEDRRHFYAFSARVMRMILIDHARSHRAASAGGGAIHLPLNDELVWVEIGSPDLLDLNRALEELEALDAMKVRMVELRFFLGCTAEETADVMEISKSKVDRDLRFAKTWLFRRMYPDKVAGGAAV
jgi:RNA polymerase sigma factor (TIGR02999 family)